MTTNKILEDSIVNTKYYQKKIMSSEFPYHGHKNPVTNEDKLQIYETHNFLLGAEEKVLCWNGKSIKLQKDVDRPEFFVGEINNSFYGQNTLKEIKKNEIYLYSTDRDKNALFLFLFKNCEELTRNIILDSIYYKYNPKKTVLRF